MCVGVLLYLWVSLGMQSNMHAHCACIPDVCRRQVCFVCVKTAGGRLYANMQICGGSSFSQIRRTHMLAGTKCRPHIKSLMTAKKPPGAVQGFYDETVRVDWTQDQLQVNDYVYSLSLSVSTHIHPAITLSLSLCTHNY